MNIDLHCHTNVSDGVLTPNQLIDLAIDRGVDVLSITDHDTLGAYSIIDAVPPHLQLIPGIEFSSQWRKQGVHIVGLNIDLANESIIKAVTQQSEGRKRRAQIIAEKLKGLGFDNCLEGAQSICWEPHRPTTLCAISCANWGC